MMKGRWHSWTTAAAAAIFSASMLGCMGLGQPGQPIRYWVLGALPDTEPTNEAAERPTLQVGPLDLPAHLDRPGIVTRTGDHRLVVAQFDHWGEPLPQGIKRVLAENIMAQLPGVTAVIFPWKGAGMPDYQLSLAVSRLDARRDGNVELFVSWGLQRQEDARDFGVWSERLVVPVEGDEIGDVVAAMSRALQELSRLMVESLVASSEEMAGAR